MGVFISIDLVPNVKMTSSTSSSGSDCSKYDCKIESGRVAKYDYDVKDSGSKSCAGKVAAPDLTQYVWDYKNDENKDLGLEVGAVVHNREWSYGLVKYASLVQVAVSFKARCTFSFRDEGATRTLRIIDDTGYVHGELDINIHAGTPCVCAVPRKEKIAVKDKVIRCPQKLSSRKPGTCGEKLPTPSSSTSIEEVRANTSVKVKESYQRQANAELQRLVNEAKRAVASKYGA